MRTWKYLPARGTSRKFHTSTSSTSPTAVIALRTHPISSFPSPPNLTSALSASLPEVSQLCQRFSMKNTMHRFWFWIFLLEQRSWVSVCTRSVGENSRTGFCSRALWIFGLGIFAFGWGSWKLVVQMSVDGHSKELKELNQRLRDGKKIAGGEHGLCEGDEVNCNGVAEEVKVGQGGTVESSSIQQHIPQPQGALICWERFLHIRSLKVLLVENDDSTRHVVTALLRNCSYEVIEAANGLQAWKMLEDLTNHIDLVLTEVAMPGLSGIGLLYKIMGHKTRKNIPVVMMSSHDSMGLVFKCLSKGAVDFLVKPIRKNELKNLWQHVWRRCHSSSGSGSESGTQTQKSVKKSDNNSGSSDEDDNGSVGLNGDGSDNGSGTQALLNEGRGRLLGVGLTRLICIVYSKRNNANVAAGKSCNSGSSVLSVVCEKSSWTKRAVEVDSPKPVSQWDQIAECPDSTCAQVVHSNAEIGGKQVVPLAAKESPERKEQFGKAEVH
ncbi:unnamed protein product [Sphenostylis stenocarpa]|uniref:Response regulatory domain-containing protein n=1 Tax=Sphenostylis stenocarpa TaxID=92480 RepID=A0AA86SS33_9FABA|nr:unnamed protein product [Sphenostylis stenocarpa]